MAVLPETRLGRWAGFRGALPYRAICAPGEVVDRKPGKRRSGRPARFRQYGRFSFGPEEQSIVEGVRRIGEMVRSGER